MIEINFFPLYGIVAGVNYWNDTFSEDEEEYDDCQHTIQVFLLLFGFNIVWYEKYN